MISLLVHFFLSFVVGQLNNSTKNAILSRKNNQNNQAITKINLKKRRYFAGKIKFYGLSWIPIE